MSNVNFMASRLIFILIYCIFIIGALPSLGRGRTIKSIPWHIILTPDFITFMDICMQNIFSDFIM